MKTVTGAARKLTGASMAAFLTLDADEADDVLFVRATLGPRAGVVARRRGPDRRAAARGGARGARRRSASTTRGTIDEYAAHARRDHAGARAAAAQLRS